jgi:hypothetical protein
MRPKYNLIQVFSTMSNVQILTHDVDKDLNQAATVSETFFYITCAFHYFGHCPLSWVFSNVFQKLDLSALSRVKSLRKSIQVYS